VSDLEIFASGLDHAEGIALAPDGYLYAGGEAGQLYRISADGDVTEVMTTGGFLLGIAADAASRIYACDQANHVVWRLDPRARTAETFFGGTSDRPLRVPNWGAFDGAGNYYLTDSGGWRAADGCVWVVRPGGRAEVWCGESVDFPNGCAVAPDQSCLYVVESVPGRVVEIPIRADGSAGPRRVLLELPGTVPDGVAVERDGSLVIACYRPDVIYRACPDGRLEVLAEDPEGTVLAAPTNVGFAGERLDQWVVPNLGRWHLTRGSGVSGSPLFYPSREQLQPYPLSEPTRAYGVASES
jgi:gluconolactonase